MFVSVARKKPQAKFEKHVFCAKAIIKSLRASRRIRLALVAHIYQTKTKRLVEGWRDLHFAEARNDQETRHSDNPVTFLVFDRTFNHSF